MTTKFQRLLSFPVVAMFILLGFVYYATVFVFMKDWFGLETSNGFLNALIFTFFAFLFVFSFVVAVVTDPGQVSPSYVPDVELIVASDQESNKTSARVRQCDKCSAHKPPRAHHCKVCRRCVLRMDHHCLWMNNCVGYQNYKAFVLLALYATIGSLYSTVMVIGCALQREWSFSEKVQLKMFYVACGIMMVSLSLAFGTLFGWHVFLIFKNMTTIESHEAEQAAWLARKSGQSYRHPFNLGAYKNITLILGPNMLTWFCPTAMSHLKDGTSFPTSSHTL